MAHPKPNFNKMLQLIDEVFSTRNDPDQIQVNQQQLKKLQKIHPASLTELANDAGPLIWILMIPTTASVMNDFVAGKISERELLARTKPGENYDSIYLCSATTLPEYRGKGETKKLCLKTIKTICLEYPIKTLFVWPFTNEGNQLAESLASATGLKLLKKDNRT